MKAQILKCLALVSFVTLAVSGCAKNDKFIYHEKLKENGWVSNQINVKSIRRASGVDLIWVVDNSGSMGWAQYNIIQNAEKFMEEFIKQKLDWRLGLISTDTTDEPFLGLKPGNIFDSNTPDPIEVFKSAVGDLGIYGDGTEKPYQTLINSLDSYPNFLRPSNPLVMIFVTDAEEQSRVSTQELYDRIRVKIGPSTGLYSYMILGADDLNCSDGEGFDYANGKYEELVKIATLGRAYSLCTNNFGQLLGNIGLEIAEQVSRSKIFLQDRPRLDSISISYQGEILPGGTEAEGAYWYYDYGQNAIIFYNLSFTTDVTAFVELNYKIDDGFND